MKKTRTDGGIRPVVVATGIASVAVQLVLVREYLAQFQGNEIVIALIFFAGWSMAASARPWPKPGAPAGDRLQRTS